MFRYRRILHPVPDRNVFSGHLREYFVSCRRKLDLSFIEIIHMLIFEERVDYFQVIDEVKKILS